MKLKHFFGVTALLLGILILLLTLPNFNPTTAHAEDSTASRFAIQQAIPTPQNGDGSEIGSTDGILVMGMVIVLIVTLPLIFRKSGR